MWPFKKSMLYCNNCYFRHGETKCKRNKKENKYTAGISIGKIENRNPNKEGKCIYYIGWLL